MAYGEPLTTGRGMTTQIRPEAIEAAMTVAPAAGLLGRGVERGAMAAGRAGERLAERVVPQVMERGGLPAQLLGDLSQGSISPMDVWHGSPYGPFQKFDPSKARTGEGNATFGEGAYLAQARGTGEQYRKVLGAQSMTIDGKPIADKITNFEIQKLVGEYSQDLPKLKKELTNYVREFSNNPYADITSAKNIAKAIDENKFNVGTEGYLYKVDLPDEAIPKMIDWDKPLGQQNKDVQKAIEKTKSMLPPNAIEDLGGDLSLLYGKDVTPEQFLNTWESFGKKAGGETALAEQGDTGVRYLDQESRNAGLYNITPPTETVSGKWMVKGTDYNSKGMHFDTEAEAIAKLQEMNANNTSNFVVFPKYQDLLTIKEINDKPLKRNLLD
jgi:hypothetical protein